MVNDPRRTTTAAVGTTTQKKEENSVQEKNGAVSAREVVTNPCWFANQVQNAHNKTLRAYKAKKFHSLALRGTALTVVGGAALIFFAPFVWMALTAYVIPYLFPIIEVLNSFFSFFKWIFCGKKCKQKKLEKKVMKKFFQFKLWVDLFAPVYQLSRTLFARNSAANQIMKSGVLKPDFDAAAKLRWKRLNRSLEEIKEERNADTWLSSAKLKKKKSDQARDESPLQFHVLDEKIATMMFSLIEHCKSAERELFLVGGEELQDRIHHLQARFHAAGKSGCEPHFFENGKDGKEDKKIVTYSELLEAAKNAEKDAQMEKWTLVTAEEVAEMQGKVVLFCFVSLFCLW